MTKIININENILIQTVVAFTKNGDETVLEEKGKPIAKITPIDQDKQNEPKQLILGLGSGKGYFMSDDFDDELPDEFWGFDKKV